MNNPVLFGSKRPLNLKLTGLTKWFCLYINHKPAMNLEEWV